MLFFQAWKRVNQFDDLCNSHVFLEYKITRNAIYMCKPNISFLGCCLVAHCRLVDHKSASLCFQKKNCPRDHPLPNCHHPGIGGTRWYPVDSYEPTFKEMRSSMHSVPPRILKKHPAMLRWYCLDLPQTSLTWRYLDVFGFVRETRGTMLGWFRTAIRMRFSVKTKISTQKQRQNLTGFFSWSFL